MLGDSAHLDTGLGGQSGSSEIISGDPQYSGNAQAASSGGAEGLCANDLQFQGGADHPLDDPASLNPSSLDIPPGDIEDLWLQDTIHLGDLQTAADFVKELQGATLDDPSLGMSDEALHRLRNPLCDQPPTAIDNVI